MIQVYFHSDKKKTKLGRLAIKNRKIFFEYSKDFLESKLEISPFKLPLKTGLIESQNKNFEGLFGVFNDSLPDGWGRLLLDRKFRSLGENPKDLSPLERLCHVGSHAMGALSYEPSYEKEDSKKQNDLDQIADEIIQVQDFDNEEYVEELLALNSSSAGARPKVILNIDGSEWIIKFPSSYDPKDIGAIEYAYHQMARTAGLVLPEAKLFPSKTGPGFFGTKRFDRLENNTRIHMHTASGLLEVDHREFALDYEQLLVATLSLTKDQSEVEKQFRHAAFNIFAHNRDDHAKNFAFTMQGTGQWQVSPAYDLTYSSGPGGEHCTTIFGEGKNPGVSHLLKLAEVSGLSKSAATLILEQVKQAISKWKQIAKSCGVSRTSLLILK